MLKLLLAAGAFAAAGSPAVLVERVSSDLNDYNPSFSRDDQTMVFARSMADFADARIMISSRQGDEWSEPGPIGFSDPRFSDSDPWLTPDGQTLYFVSDRPTVSRPEKKDLDIWRSRLTPEGWSAPEHLGDAVNSPGPELGPELHDGMLTFSSVRHGGKGGLDIYQSRLGPAGFEAAVPLPGPFNSAESESDFTISSDGRMAAFWRGGQTGAIHTSERQGPVWGEVVRLGIDVNVGPFNFTPAFSDDGRKLWYASTRERDGQPAGLADIYIVSLPGRGFTAAGP